MSRVEVSDLLKTYFLRGRPIDALQEMTFVLEDSSFVAVVGKKRLMGGAEDTVIDLSREVHEFVVGTS